MKYLLHYPTEQYGFISAEVEGTLPEAVSHYLDIRDAFRPQPQGMSDSDFRTLYDKVASKQPIQDDPGVLEQLNPQQRFALNELKKWTKRHTK